MLNDEEFQVLTGDAQNTIDFSNVPTSELVFSSGVGKLSNPVQDGEQEVFFRIPLGFIPKRATVSVAACQYSVGGLSSPFSFRILPYRQRVYRDGTERGLQVHLKVTVAGQSANIDKVSFFGAFQKRTS